MSVLALQLLLIENSEADAGLVRQALACPNPAVQTHLHVASSLQGAEQVLQRQSVDLILLNTQMDDAGQDALEWLQHFKAAHHLRRIPVIVLTRRNDDQHVNAAYQQHASAYLVKPEGLEELRGMLQAMLLFWGQVAHLPPPAQNLLE